MHVTMVKEAWTDERLDDLSNGVGEVRAEVRDLRKEVAVVREGLAEIRTELKALTKTIDARFDAQQKYMDARFDHVIRTMQIGFGLIGAVLAALLGMVATQL